MAIKQSTTVTILKTILTIAVAIPFLLCIKYYHTECNLEQYSEPLYKSNIMELNWGNFLRNAFEKDTTCRLGVHHSLFFVNYVYFFCINLLFWVISVALDNHFLIDPYWVFANNLCCIYYYVHKNASSADSTRSLAAIFIMTIWTLRLTLSYLRREEYCVGHRQDWRFTDMQKANPRWWWQNSFFLAYISQQPMIVGQSLPFWAVHLGQNATTPFGTWTDLVGCAMGLGGLVIANIADTQQFNFMQENEKRKNKVKILYSGLWKYSRHPNYFGENLYWFGLGMLAYNAGEPWVVAGPALNFIVMVISMNMIEERMVRSETRADAFKDYCKSTSFFIPLPNFTTLNPEHYTESSKIK